MFKVSIGIDVSDMELGIEFYSRALGCEVVRNDAGTSKLASENVTIYLLLKKAGSNALPEGTALRSYERHWTPVHLDFHVQEIELAVAQVKELGGSHEGSKAGEWGEIAFCSDPFGNGFCLSMIAEKYL